MSNIVKTIFLSIAVMSAGVAHSNEKHQTHNKIAQYDDKKHKSVKAKLNKPIKVKKHKVKKTQKVKSRTKIYDESCNETGIASWYGKGFIGKKTASGERFTKTNLTAAHKKLPLGSMVRVTNTSTSESVIVRINDRGPFKPGRILDLSEAAARQIGIVNTGIAKVTMQVISVPNTM